MVVVHHNAWANLRFGPCPTKCHAVKPLGTRQPVPLVRWRRPHAATLCRMCLKASSRPKTSPTFRLPSPLPSAYSSCPPSSIISPSDPHAELPSNSPHAVRASTPLRRSPSLSHSLTSKGPAQTPTSLSSPSTTPISLRSSSRCPANSCRTASCRFRVRSDTHIPHSDQRTPPRDSNRFGWRLRRRLHKQKRPEMLIILNWLLQKSGIRLTGKGMSSNCTMAASMSLLIPEIGIG